MSSQGPYLILAAFWQDADNTDEVAEALARARFPVPSGYPGGCVVAFRREVAESAAFQRDLARFDLAELEPHPKVSL
jgi:hypothetical protein